MLAVPLSQIHDGLCVTFMMGNVRDVIEAYDNQVLKGGSSNSLAALEDFRDDIIIKLIAILYLADDSIDNKIN